MRVLLAEDEDVWREAMRAALTRLGYEVTTAAAGDEAWEALRSEPAPGLAILDWVMPGYSGPEVCRMARAAPALRGLYIILLTGRSGSESVVEGLQAGANDYITKPFDPQELRARLHVAAQAVQRQAELTARISELEAALERARQAGGAAISTA